MNKIPVSIHHSDHINYQIMIGADLYKLTWLPKQKFNRMVIITDDIVKKQYGFNLHQSLQKAGHQSLLLSFPSGEKYKNYQTKQAIENKMQLHSCDRNTLVIALGGGVVGDLAGFIAATYLRGIPYVQIPTSILAMIDSSVGGKTGINTGHGKNLIGVIYQPLCVVTDIKLLKTLSRKNMINGLIEAIKMFLIFDEEFLHYTEANLNQLIEGDESLLKKIITRAVQIKAGVVSRDAKDAGVRHLLNFGHTIGHALEKLSNYTLAHGYAVGYGILVEISISHLLGFLEKQQLLLIKNLFARLGIHSKYLKKYKLSNLINATKNDKKARFGNIHYILLTKIGKPFLSNGNFTHVVETKIIKQAIKNLLEE